MVLGFTKTMVKGNSRVPTNFEEKIKSGVKIHTIRWDEKNRWSDGKKIHFATGVRSSNYNCFKEGVCKGVQKISIENRAVFIDDVILQHEEFIELVKNDGFDTVDDFWSWFDQYTPFEGKIIHWTNLLY